MNTREPGGILVVEDEPLVAMDIASTLEAAGFAVIGPAYSNAEALALLKEARCQGAVLDVQLGAETSEPLARKLSAERVPFVTLTGYARTQLAHAYQNAPTVSKPMQPELLVATLKKHLARGAAR